VDSPATIDRARDLAGRTCARLPRPVQDVVHAARDSDLLLFAGGLAFYSLVSIAPAVVLGFWIAAALAGSDRIEELGENVAELVGGGAAIESTFAQLASVGTGVGLGALVLALWPATAFGSGLLRAFDHIAGTPERRSAQGLRGRAKALLLIGLIPALLLGGLAVSYVVTGMVGDGAAGTVIGWALAVAGGWLATTGIITVLYWLFGPLRLAARSQIGGAALAALAVAVMSLGYVVYLSSGADWEERVAGSGLAGVVLLALWLYLTNLLLLAGYFAAREADEHVLERSPEEQGRPEAEEKVHDEEADSVDLRDEVHAR
jgi:membrane protein